MNTLPDTRIMNGRIDLSRYADLIDTLEAYLPNGERPSIEAAIREWARSYAVIIWSADQITLWINSQNQAPTQSFVRQLLRKIETRYDPLMGLSMDDIMALVNHGTDVDLRPLRTSDNTKLLRGVPVYWKKYATNQMS